MHVTLVCSSTTTQFILGVGGFGFGVGGLVGETGMEVVGGIVVEGLRGVVGISVVDNSLVVLSVVDNIVIEVDGIIVLDVVVLDCEKSEAMISKAFPVIQQAHLIDSRKNSCPII